MARTNFTDLQKAEIYARDLATCAFSGANLWLLDFGAAGTYMPDWADHIIPASQGGESTVDNGICASWLYNYNKSANVGASIYLFRFGLPTQDYLLVHQEVPEWLESLWERFAPLHYSDWYFNRAIWRLLLGVSWLHDPNSLKGEERKRDNIYYAKAAFKMITEWKKIVAKEKVTSLEERLLVPDPLQEDHNLLLGIRTATSEDAMLEAMTKLLPYHVANFDIEGAFLQVYEGCLAGHCGQGDIDRLISSLDENPFITSLIKKRVTSNVNRLHNILKYGLGILE